jgi:hypothetical protein
MASFNMLQTVQMESTFSPYKKAFHQPSCFSQKVGTAGWRNDYGTVRF